IPARTSIDAYEFLARGRALLDEFDAADQPRTSVLTNRAQQEAIHALETTCERAHAPLLKMEHKLHGLVAFAIMPLFALANAGVSFGAELGAGLAMPVTLGVILGLVVGKPVGILLLSWLAVRAGVAVLPSAVSWRALHGVSWLAGIGFTMSIFIAGLAFTGAPALLDSAKVGILAGSVVAGIGGWLLLRGTGVHASRAGRAAEPAGEASPEDDALDWEQARGPS
ncbi:MAG: Na+/H+ antiporter NhaA, partial [Gemmatimonadota bacterium]|nr:Na+/H+ antiporter NhaA [Gemmatimonadota bacterium]